MVLILQDDEAAPGEAEGRRDSRGQDAQCRGEQQDAMEQRARDYRTQQHPDGCNFGSAGRSTTVVPRRRRHWPRRRFRDRASPLWRVWYFGRRCYWTPNPATTTRGAWRHRRGGRQLGRFVRISDGSDGSCARCCRRGSCCGGGSSSYRRSFAGSGTCQRR